ncbi:hypothetical protein V474_08855 [Novosphingobium barchaimii LL02]|uniref:Uncharacterized protein n=1 Tax=Novosphingobium barchaimii LL02 TaxID=1114963 RepID=A0A0J7Y7K7_9SPHN|nr:hypothetical protein V474_08855 [Novosphingobium barchaimii LL02]
MITAGPAQARTDPADKASPSFSCASAQSTVEKAICADPALAAADRDMAALFALARQSAFGSGPSNELVTQRQTLKDMRDCEKTVGTVLMSKCLAAIYRNRNGELATAVLMRAPETALPILRRVDAGFAPVLEATALWAGEPVNAKWSAPERMAKKKRIMALLQPYLTKLRTNEDQSFGWSILSNPGVSAPTVARIEDIFLSDRHFAALLNVLGPYLPEDSGTVITRTLPCAAIVRHPALLEATDSVFGSTMDNFVLRSDCEQTLPPAPALSALDSKINDTWPKCEGTIRFAAYRSYGNALSAARLGRTDHAGAPDAAAPNRVSLAEIDAARRELVRYYATYLGKSSSDATITANDAIAALLSAAHSCGT